MEHDERTVLYASAKVSALISTINIIYTHTHMHMIRIFVNTTHFANFDVIGLSRKQKETEERIVYV